MAAIHSKIDGYGLSETGSFVLSCLKQLAYSFMITKIILYIYSQKTDRYKKYVVYSSTKSLKE